MVGRSRNGKTRRKVLVDVYTHLSRQKLKSTKTNRSGSKITVVKPSEKSLRIVQIPLARRCVNGPVISYTVDGQKSAEAIRAWIVRQARTPVPE
jgi:hypothetical protein